MNTAIRTAVAKTAQFLGILPTFTPSYEVLFGIEAAGKPEHGVIVGSWVRMGKHSDVCISFHFDGNEHAPKLTPSLMEDLWNAALMTGIVPTHVYSYQGMLKEPQRR